MSDILSSIDNDRTGFVVKVQTLHREEGTRDGLPKSIVRITAANASACLAHIKELHEKVSSASAQAIDGWTAVQTVEQTIAVGRDHGQVCPLVDGVQDLVANRSNPLPRKT